MAEDKEQKPVCHKTGTKYQNLSNFIEDNFRNTVPMDYGLDYIRCLLLQY